MPVLNEERYLADSVAHILSQDYPGPLELVLALGPSRDRTTEIAREIAAADPRVTVVDNPTGKRPTAMNAAIKAARHEVIARVDGHAELPPDYLSLAVQTLQETGAVNVGGIMSAEGITPFQQAVAWAMTSPFGVGASRFHTGGQAGPADTVYLGVYRREAIEQAGGYDEEFLVAEDWEMNHRIRRCGGMIWFQPAMRVTYRPRASVPALAHQYFHYGRWRRVVARQHTGTINLRYAAPPAAVTLIAAGTLAGLAGVAGLAAGAAGLLARRGHRRIRRARRLRRGRAGRGREGRPAAAAAGRRPAACRPGHHAHVVGRRVPDQPAAAGPARAGHLRRDGPAAVLTSYGSRVTDRWLY